MSSQAGKGSAPRPVDPTIYGSNYNDIFRKNIVMDKHADIRLLAWGKEVD